eukprot:1906804-Amphidinium_carterae.1
MWLVKSHRVWIQGRFGHAKQVKRSFLKGRASTHIPFMRGTYPQTQNPKQPYKGNRTHPKTD